MLTTLAIRNFAIVDSVELELQPGLTVLTGETGAGKSILVDALSLVLGDRADASAIRHGADKAEVSVSADVSGLPGVTDWLAQRDLDVDGECLLRRVVSRNSRSRGYINGVPVPIQSLRELGQQLVDIQGQHEHQSLTQRPAQRRLVDGFGKLQAALAATADAYQQWHRLEAEFHTLCEAQRQRDSQLDLLKFQIRELDELALQPGELEGLEDEQRRLGHAGQLAEGTRTALDALYDADTSSAQATLSLAARTLGSLVEFDPVLAEAHELTVSAGIQVSEAADALRRYVDGLEADPARQDQVETRLATVKSLARKHGVDQSALTNYHTELGERLFGLENAQSRLTELESQRDAAIESYRKAARALSGRRVRAARVMSKKVTAAMQELGMPHGVFHVDLHHDPQGKPAAEGLDRVEFQIAPNPGQPKQSLSKTASGGELSRIALAIQVVAADVAPVPSMVFDEVDSGVGGGVAEIVGQRLRSLGGHRQVLSVTHLPQVASQAHHHLKVLKLTDGETTRTRVDVLTRKSRVEELARMLGGVKITRRTRDHAEEMLARANGQGASA